jgi:hypothetical protein
LLDLAVRLALIEHQQQAGSFHIIGSQGAASRAPFEFQPIIRGELHE